MIKMQKPEVTIKFTQKMIDWINVNSDTQCFWALCTGLVFPSTENFNSLEDIFSYTREKHGGDMLKAINSDIDFISAFDPFQLNDIKTFKQFLLEFAKYMESYVNNPIIYLGELTYRSVNYPDFKWSCMYSHGSNFVNDSEVINVTSSKLASGDYNVK